MDRWTMQELKETDDITFAILILQERGRYLSPYSPLRMKLAAAAHTLSKIREEKDSFFARVAATGGESRQYMEDYVADLSECDETVKAQIMENASLLDERDATKCDPCQPTQPECGECEYAGGEQLA